jgi:hypothetical protein
MDIFITGDFQTLMDIIIVNSTCTDMVLQPHFGQVWG